MRRGEGRRGDGIVLGWVGLANLLCAVLGMRR